MKNDITSSLGLNTATMDGSTVAMPLQAAQLLAALATAAVNPGVVPAVPSGPKNPQKKGTA
jgi:hypothetical protein